MCSQKVQPYTKQWQPKKIFLFMALKGTFQMWPREELSKASVDRQVLFNPVKHRLWKEKKKPSQLLSFLKRRGGVGVEEKGESYL